MTELHQELYSIVYPPGVPFVCWWSLAPTEEDSWRFFAKGCLDERYSIVRAKGEGYKCVVVRVTWTDPTEETS